MEVLFLGVRRVVSVGGRIRHRGAGRGQGGGGQGTVA